MKTTGGAPCLILNRLAQKRLQVSASLGMKQKSSATSWSGMYPARQQHIAALSKRIVIIQNELEEIQKSIDELEAHK